jgi:hypothetical protein
LEVMAAGVIPFTVPYASLKDLMTDGRGVILHVPGYGGDSPLPSLVDGDWGRLTRGLASLDFMTRAVSTVVQHLSDPHIDERRQQLMVTSISSLLRSYLFILMMCCWVRFIEMGTFPNLVSTRCCLGEYICSE